MYRPTNKYGIILLVSISCMMLNFYASAQNSAIIESGFIFKEAPFKECHASTIEYTSEGLIASWFGGTRERNKNVEIWMSRNLDGQWSKPISVAHGIQHKDKRYPTWNPVLFQMPDGPLMLFYKVGPNPREWWGEVKTSDDQGKTWSEARRLPEDFLGPIKNKPILTNNGHLLSPSSTEHDGWRVHFEKTTDAGKTWEFIGPINKAEEYNIIQPSILNHEGDTLQILARSREGRIMSSWSYDGGDTSDKVYPTELPNPNSGTDALTLASGMHLLVYNHSEKEEGEWGGARSPLNVALSNNGVDWETVLTLEDEPREYSYPAVIQSEDGLVHITYTWRRERIKHIVLDLEKINF